jgi:predicted RNase H-like HicB family nuclease
MSPNEMRYSVRLAKSSDGGWLADVTEAPAVRAEGGTREEALALAQARVLRILAESLELGHIRSAPLSVAFVVAP